MRKPPKSPDMADTLAAGSSIEGRPTTLTPDGELVAGRFRILGLVGVGGMGTVYRARDVELDEVVALKMLRPHLVASPAMLERFRREVKLARRVTHVNVARTYDIGEHGEQKFLTMELIDGESLAAVLARDGALPVARAVELVRPLCAGLAAAHAAGVVHRDLKPDNILIASDGRLAITDFGVAAARAEGTVDEAGLTGTPAYMAPEQVDGGPVDARADIYALGAVLYEMLAGVPPFEGASPLAVAVTRLRTPPPDLAKLRPDLPAALAAAVRKCMARERTGRFGSVEEVEQAIVAATANVATASPAPHRQQRARPRTGLAVLPFRAARPEDEYLAEGVTDDLIDTLSVSPDLRVRSRGAVAALRDDTRDPRDLGKALGVQAVVHGVVQVDGGVARITIRLTTVADGFQVWAKKFERPAGDVLAVADHAARELVAALNAAEPPGGEVTRDPVAVDLYLRARHEHNRLSPAGSAKAIELFGEAVARAPEDPTILSAYALALARAWNFTLDGARSDLDNRAVAAAMKAATVAPERGDHHLALAQVLKLRADWIGMAKALQLALARSPSSADAHEMRGTVLLEIGDEEAGRKSLNRALELDPHLLSAPVAMATARAIQGDYGTAALILQRLVGRENEPLVITTWARMALWTRDRKTAERIDARLPAGPQGIVPKMLTAAVLGRPLSTEDATLVTRALQSGPPRRRAYFHQLQAEVLALQNRLVDAVACVEAAVEQGLIDLPWLDRGPLLGLIRFDERFAAARATVVQRIDELRPELG